MKLTILVDNNTLIDRYFLGEPGLSIFIEEDGQRLLLDVGYSEVFLINAQKMGLDLRFLDYVVLSHGHLDHTWGLDPLIRLYSEAAIEGLPHHRPVIVGHPQVFQTKILSGLPEIGSLLAESKLAHHFPLRLSRSPVPLTERLLFLGEIERRFDFEASQPLGEVERGQSREPDFLPDDSALAYKSPRGLVVIVGCAHSGICNTVEYARQVCNEARVLDIIGGFHLLNPTEERLEQTAAYLAQLGLKALHACHCTDLRSKLALSRAAPLQEVGVGLQLNYPSLSNFLNNG
ncbi:MAG: MBL fold metallo-hydrolase [Deltaproteobacteria bacterium]|nr:MBL fold metallo-hydrolase [Deltaproteobacteria bacterium]MBW1953004.1 MBL fold metallo-hydrolase [Deltaproteobacteria bacterium]MBW1985937.1 MBL fold metallo-hydrolase [Deltaproteobacteria bacterium]MBW2133697.1 MBL fold metallo-hydrolase [Deltaproteobacteria bacterium]